MSKYLEKSQLSYLWQKIKDYVADHSGGFDVNKVYPIGSQIYNSKKDFNPNTLYAGTEWKRIKGYVLAGINEEDTETSDYLNFNKVSGSKLGVSWQEFRAWIGAYDSDIGKLGYHACSKVEGQSFTYGLLHSSDQSNIDFGRINHTAQVSNSTGHTKVSVIQPTQLTYIWERTA